MQIRQTAPGREAARAHRGQVMGVPVASAASWEVRGLGWLPVRNMVLLTALVCADYRPVGRVTGDDTVLVRAYAILASIRVQSWYAQVRAWHPEEQYASELSGCVSYQSAEAVPSLVSRAVMHGKEGSKATSQKSAVSYGHKIDI